MCSVAPAPILLKEVFKKVKVRAFICNRIKCEEDGMEDKLFS